MRRGSGFVLLFMASCASPTITAKPATGPTSSVSFAKVEHTLDIHCGVWGTTFDGSDWDAAPTIDDGSRNPRPEWRAEDDADGTGSDSIEGTIRLTAPDEAVFESRGGLTATFVRRPSPFPEDWICE